MTFPKCYYHVMTLYQSLQFIFAILIGYIIFTSSPTVMETVPLILESVKVHVYCPQYPESTLVRNSSDNLNAESTKSLWLEMFADIAVVDQTTGVATFELTSRHVMAPF